MTAKRILRILLAVVVLMLGVLVVLGQTPEKNQKATFTAADKEVINTYYKHLHSTLAPASLDRKSFPPEIEKVLAPGGKVPLQMEKQLERLPRELEQKLSVPPAGYDRFSLGHHVLLVRRSDLSIADIVKEAGWK